MEKKAFMKKKASRSPPPPFSVHFLTVPPTVHHSGGTVIQIPVDEGKQAFLIVSPYLFDEVLNSMAFENSSNNDTRLAKLA